MSGDVDVGRKITYIDGGWVGGSDSIFTDDMKILK